MTDWATFAAATVVLTLSLLYLTRRSRRMLERIRIVDADSASVADRERDAETESDVPADHAVNTDRRDEPHGSSTRPDPFERAPTVTTTLLLANVTLSQALALVTLVAVAWWTGVPASAFGLGPDPLSTVLGWGVVAGVVCYIGNESAVAIGKRVGATVPERLREAMAPTDAREWAVLLVVVLPVIALFEEALFRGALIGAFALGFGIDPWLLAVASSVAFGLGHGTQGRLGIAVTGTLGFALAALFVYTGSLLVVVVAHYVVNALEFVVHEGLRDDAAVGHR